MHITLITSLLQLIGPCVCYNNSLLICVLTHRLQIWLMTLFEAACKAFETWYKGLGCNSANQILAQPAMTEVTQQNDSYQTP